MKLPVVIAAYNEAAHIERTLRGLPKDVEPIVVANGCQDETFELAKKSGATAISLETGAKTGAMQAGIKHIGSRAMEGFVTLDADSYPIRPASWLRIIQQSLSEQEIMTMCGEIAYCGGSSRSSNVVRTVRRFIRNARNDSGEIVYGANMTVKPNEAALERLLELPETLWPTEDYAIKDIIVAQGGVHTLNMDPRLTVFTSARALPPLRKRITQGQQFSKNACEDWYADRAPTDQMTYLEWLETDGSKIALGEIHSGVLVRERSRSTQ